MTKSEFLSRMDIAKYRAKGTFDRGFGICRVLSETVSLTAKFKFLDLFNPSPYAHCYFMDYEYLESPYRSQSFTITQLNKEDATEKRLNALLLFELACLEYKLYLEF
jgi:hypothetical protein